MTKEEAFRKWIKKADQTEGEWEHEDLWNAACDWQKAQDKKEIKRLQEYEWMYKELQK